MNFKSNDIINQPLASVSSVQQPFFAALNGSSPASIQKKDSGKTDWVVDKNGDLFFENKSEAEARMGKLQKEGQWEEFKVEDFKDGSKIYWRVKMRGKKKVVPKKDKPEDKDPESKKPEEKAPENKKLPKEKKTKKKETKSEEEKAADKKPSEKKAESLPDPVFALTFDDGPHSAKLGSGDNRTENVLDVLNGEGIKGAFFIQTAAVGKDDGIPMRGSTANGKILVKRMFDDGHIVGIHTGGKADHELHTEAAKKGTLEKELESAKTYVKEVTGKEADYVRPPTGVHNEAVDKIYEKVGLINLLWDIDGDEGTDLDLGSLQGRLDTSLTTAYKNGWKPWMQTVTTKIVILYHDIQKGTSKNIKNIISYIKDKVKKMSNNKNTAKFDKP